MLCVNLSPFNRSTFNITFVIFILNRSIVVSWFFQDTRVFSCSLTVLLRSLYRRRAEIPIASWTMDQWQKDMDLVKHLKDLIPIFNGEPELFCAFRASVLVANTIACTHPSSNNLILLLNVVKSRLTGPFSLVVSRHTTVKEILVALEHYYLEKAK